MFCGIKFVSKNNFDKVECTYFGHGFSEQDYAWIKSGMIFPFVDYVDRYLIVGLFFSHFSFSLSIMRRI